MRPLSREIAASALTDQSGLTSRLSRFASLGCQEEFGCREFRRLYHLKVEIEVGPLRSGQSHGLCGYPPLGASLCVSLCDWQLWLGSSWLFRPSGRKLMSHQLGETAAFRYWKFPQRAGERKTTRLLPNGGGRRDRK
jgi:hypothetical protein